ncbi:hypothetical protein Ssi02_07860 [Sinosporangium siamense]|uniref:BD-FAE-like domain-containing protein n=1 Tax=Sinosporangium siamense TaxID=1367973 RepID=A0A919V331_9ACTN|nr:hypothetical protein Ssi02_07860 [Sinosporangium siamense]
MVVGSEVVADPISLGEIAEREFAALGVSGWVVPVSTPDEALKAIPAGAAVVVPGPDPELRRLMTEPRPANPVTEAVPGVVWLDIHRTGPVTVPHGDAHVYGRGINGLSWAIRHAVHRLQHPARRVPYGTHPDQWGDLRLPRETDRPVPAVAVIHGGYWRSVWAADLTDALCADLADKGFAAWNIEYRRPDLHGWDATTADVAAALAAMHELDAPLDLGRVAVAGHSAGGQLALRAAADGARVALTVSLAGVLDLAEFDRRYVSSGAVAGALGGSVDELPEVYRRSSPLERLPIGVPTVVVQGTHDDPDLIDASRRYVRAADAAGDDVTHLEAAGDHFAVIDPSSALWESTIAEITRRLGQ